MTFATSEVTGTDGADRIPDTVCSESQEVQRCAQRYGRLHQKALLWGRASRGAISFAGKRISNSLTRVPTSESEPCD